MKIEIVINATTHQIEASIYDAKSVGGYYRRLLLFSGKLHEWPKMMKLIDQQGNTVIQRVIEGSRPANALTTEKRRDP